MEVFDPIMAKIVARLRKELIMATTPMISAP
jgi:hypothetical protein